MENVNILLNVSSSQGQDFKCLFLEQILLQIHWDIMLCKFAQIPKNPMNCPVENVFMIVGGTKSYSGQQFFCLFIGEMCH